MELVVDANVLFSALIKKGMTSDLLFKHTLYAPEYIFVEFNQYKEEISAKTHRSEEEYKEFFDLLSRNIILIPKEEIDPFIEKAENISPDPKDVAYLALAMKLQCPLWSQDKALKKQIVVKVFSTEELNAIT